MGLKRPHLEVNFVGGSFQLCIIFIADWHLNPCDLSDTEIESETNRSEMSHLVNIKRKHIGVGENS